MGNQLVGLDARDGGLGAGFDFGNDNAGVIGQLLEIAADFISEIPHGQAQRRGFELLGGVVMGGAFGNDKVFGKPLAVSDQFGGELFAQADAGQGLIEAVADAGPGAGNAVKILFGHFIEAVPGEVFHIEAHVVQFHVHGLRHALDVQPQQNDARSDTGLSSRRIGIDIRDHRPGLAILRKVGDLMDAGQFAVERLKFHAQPGHTVLLGFAERDIAGVEMSQQIGKDRGKVGRSR